MTKIHQITFKLLDSEFNDLIDIIYRNQLKDNKGELMSPNLVSENVVRLWIGENRDSKIE